MSIENEFIKIDKIDNPEMLLLNCVSNAECTKFSIISLVLDE